MLFTSHVFTLVFLPIVMGMYLCFYRYLGLKPALSILTLSSLFFYGWWNPVYLWLIGFSIIINFVSGRLLVTTLSAGGRRLILICAVSINLVLLGYFKYSGFLVDNINAIAGLELTIDAVVLPLAISFFTFQQISYVVDIYKNNKTIYQFTDYILFVTFFPQLIAGPIVRHDTLIPQFSNPYANQQKSIWISRGIVLFTIGLFKKVVLANALEDISTPYFESVFSGSGITFLDSWQAALAFTFQIYFDFSAYSDMAIGLALMFGFTIPENFNIPYASFDIQEFWRRWHISLSTFLRDYLYIPLGGSRNGLIRQLQALIATMFLGGLWHGASWSFVVWGLLHGTALVLHVLWQKLGLRMPKPIGWIVLFIFLVFSWVLFRIQDFSIATDIMLSMVDIKNWEINNLDKSYWLTIIIAALIATLGPSSTKVTLNLMNPRPIYAVVVGFLLTYLIVETGYEAREFIYFQF